MKNVKNNIISGIFAVILLSATLTMGAQYNVGKEQNSDVTSFNSMHPVVKLAEATSDGTDGMTDLAEEETRSKLSQRDSGITYLDDKEYNIDDAKTDEAKAEELSEDNENYYSVDGKIHKVTIEAQKLKNGQYGYKMNNHIIKEANTEKDITDRYPKYPTIPGPTIELYKGDILILTSIDPNGNVKTQNIQPQQVGTFEYFGENYRTLGLFGAIIVDSYEKIPSKVDGRVTEVDPKDIQKQYVLFMVGSTFWGQEIDAKHNQKPLWTNPILGADLNQLVRFHILGAANQHTFHLHAHEWVDPGTANIIDTILITPNQGTSFIVQAGDRAGIGNWHYHCHVFAHMEAGMMGSFKVGPVDSQTESIPGASPLDKGPTEQGNFITFSITDEPGKFFKNVGGELLEGATESLGVVKKGGTAHFIMDDTNTVHTITTLLWPSEAENMPMNTIETNKIKTSQKENKSLDFSQSQTPMSFNLPFDQVTAYSGGGIIKLETPGLYVFTCKVHPYMFGAVIADNPDTENVLDLGEELELITGEKLNSSDPLSLTMLKTFFVANNPSNWLDYSSDNPEWNPTFPHIRVKTDLGEGYLDEALLKSIGNSSLNLSNITNPLNPGLGEVWIDTQFEITASKTKPGTITKVNTENWQVERKVSLPQINLNHPHNLWSDSSQQIIYQTQWFDNRLTAIDRNSGNLLDDIRVGDAPSHVMTNPNNDMLYVTLSGEQGIAEIKFDKTEKKFKILRIIPTQDSGQNPTHPHGHWITPDGNQVITPNHFTDDTTILDFTQNLGNGEIKSRVDAGIMPIATGMMPDGERAYVSNLLSNNINILDMGLGRVIKTIDLAAAGHAFPIQTPVSPDGQYVITANSLTGTIAIIDTDTNEVVKSLPCDPGCHGVNFGAKKDGGYYAYVTSKFSNRLIVVDGDPNNNGNPEDAVVAGTVLLTGHYNNTGIAQFDNDDNMTHSSVKLHGMGGQGVYAIPNIYPGWVQLLDLTFASQLTDEQRDPIGTFNDLKNQISGNLVTNSLEMSESLKLQDSISETIDVENQNLERDTAVLDIQSIDSLLQKENEFERFTKDSSYESKVSNTEEKSMLDSNHPNNILAMLPIPYP